MSTDTSSSHNTQSQQNRPTLQYTGPGTSSTYLTSLVEANYHHHIEFKESTSQFLYHPIRGPCSARVFGILPSSAEPESISSTSQVRDVPHGSYAGLAEGGDEATRFTQLNVSRPQLHTPSTSDNKNVEATQVYIPRRHSLESFGTLVTTNSERSVVSSRIISYVGHPGVYQNSFPASQVLTRPGTPRPTSSINLMDRNSVRDMMNHDSILPHDARVFVSQPPSHSRRSWIMLELPSDSNELPVILAAMHDTGAIFNITNPTQNDLESQAPGNSTVDS